MTGAVTVQKGVWTEVSGKSTVPAGAAGLKLYIQPAYNPNPGIENTVSYYVDDVSVKSVSDSIQEDIDGIKDVYDGYFTVGGAAGSSDLDSKARQALFLKHYNTLTMGNELKPNYTLDQAATVTAGEPQVRLNADARKMLQFAQDNGLPVRGHCLLWHAQTPTWFFRENFDIGGQAVSKEVLRERLEIYIKNTMILVQTEFPDVEFYAWDVVNEVYKDDGNLRDAGWWGEGVDNELSPWAMIYGDDSFVDDAFEFARMYAPEDCKLFYNDFNEYIPAKRDKIAEKMLSLKESGNVDGIGMQAHLDTSFPTPASFKEALDVFLYTGLEVHITELDMTINPELSLNDAVDYDINTQGQLYQELFEGIRDSRMNHPNGENLTAVVFWGTDDATSWRGDRKPLLFDGDFQAKPAYYGVIEGVVPIGSDQYNVGDVNLD
jgi:endo-1,4-beta-xylanase